MESENNQTDEWYFYCLFAFWHCLIHWKRRSWGETG